MSVINGLFLLLTTITQTNAIMDIVIMNSVTIATIPSLISSALIVSTDDHTSIDVLLVVTDISLYCLIGLLSELPCTVHDSSVPIPSHVKLASV